LYNKTFLEKKLSFILLQRQNPLLVLRLFRFRPKTVLESFFYQTEICERSLQRNSVLQHWQQRSWALRLVS